jgi:hypothetical protein
MIAINHKQTKIVQDSSLEIKKKLKGLLEIVYNRIQHFTITKFTF